MARQKIRTYERTIEVKGSGFEGALHCVYILFSRSKIRSTQELFRDVLIDFNRDGKVVGVEFIDPLSVTSDDMAELAKALGLPLLRSIAVSRVPISKHSTQIIFKIHSMSIRKRSKNGFRKSERIARTSKQPSIRSAN